MIKQLLTIFCCTLSLWAMKKQLTLHDINQYPTSLTKDGIIYLFLRQNNIKASEADIAFYQAYKVTSKLLRQWGMVTSDQNVKDFLQCQNTTNIKQLPINIIDRTDCLYLALSVNKILKHIDDKMWLKNLSVQLQEKYTDKAQLLALLSSKNFVTNITTGKHIKLFFTVFATMHYKKRQEYFNITLHDTIIDAMMAFPYTFSSFIKIAVTHIELDNVHRSLLRLYRFKNFEHIPISGEGYFFLGLNAIRYHQNKIATYYLLKALTKHKNITAKNRTLFWLYTISQDNIDKQHYLQQLANSSAIDIYTLYALEQLGITPNVITTITTRRQRPLFNSNNPLEVINYQHKNSALPMAKHYGYLAHSSTIPHLLNYYKKFFKFKKSFFYIPTYIDALDVNDKDKALLLGIARQESAFIPTAISTSYAMGLMQILPFVSDEIITKNKLPYQYPMDYNFDPQKSMTMAYVHLKVLANHLKHPLFMFYGYSNGMGFTKRLLQRAYFNRNNIYEPLISMELMPNNQARKYGKQVLTNYIIYRNAFGLPIKLRQILSQVDKSKIIK